MTNRFKPYDDLNIELSLELNDNKDVCVFIYYKGKKCPALSEYPKDRVKMIDNILSLLPKDMLDRFAASEEKCPHAELKDSLDKLSKLLGGS